MAPFTTSQVQWSAALFSRRWQLTQSVVEDWHTQSIVEDWHTRSIVEDEEKWGWMNLEGKTWIDRIPACRWSMQNLCSNLFQSSHNNTSYNNTLLIFTTKFSSSSFSQIKNKKTKNNPTTTQRRRKRKKEEKIFSSAWFSAKRNLICLPTLPHHKIVGEGKKLLNTKMNNQ